MADQNIDNLYLNFEVGGNADEKIDKIDKALEKVETQAKQAFVALEKIGAGESSNAFDKLDDSIKKAAVSIDYLMSKQGKLDGLQNELAQAYTKLLELTQGGAGYENQDVKKLVRQIERLEKDIDKLGDEGDKAFKKIDKSTKKANNSSKNYNKGLRGLLGTAKRFLIFGTFFTIQRQISQAFQDGTANLYQYSKAIDGTFAKSMDRLATSFLYLKNAIGAAVAPIINAVTPALESLIDTVAEFGNKLAETLAALTGATTFKKAIKSHKEYAEAVNKTNNALAKFDEINNITTSKSKDELDYGSMFEEAQVKTNVSSFGEAIGKGINNIIEKINKKVKEINFSGLAEKITTNLTTMINTIDWGNIGELFSTLILGAFDFIGGLVDWLRYPETIGEASDAIIEFVRAIDWVKISEELIKCLTKILSPMTWINLSLGIAKITVGLFTDEKDRKILDDAYKKITKFFQSIGDVFSYIFENMFTKDFWSGKGKKPSEFFGKSSFFASGGFPTTGQVFIARENGIPEMIGSIGGRTAVANSGQIVEAVSIGVYNAVVDAMSRSGGNKQPTIVQINGKEVFRAVQDESTAYSRRTGQPAF